MSYLCHMGKRGPLQHAVSGNTKDSYGLLIFAVLQKRRVPVKFNTLNRLTRTASESSFNSSLISSFLYVHLNF